MSVRNYIRLFLFFVAIYPGMTLGQANTSLSNLANPTSINHSLSPAVNNAISLGSSTKGWRYLHLAATGGMYMGGIRTFTVDGGNYYLGGFAGNTTASGDGNTGIGDRSLFKVTTGSYNSTTGSFALYNNTTGSQNVAMGTEAGLKNISGRNNVFIGYRAGFSSLTGEGNSFVGHRAGFNSNAQYNSAFGYEALYANTNINYNSAFGAYAAKALNGGGYNAVFGYRSLESGTQADRNAAFGASALLTNLTGDDNAAFGYSAGMINKGSYNAYFGAYAGSLVDGQRNTHIGYHAGSFSSPLSNTIALGYYTIVTANNQARIGDLNITSIGGFAPWSNVSDGRFKTNLQENVPGLAFINKLRPVTYLLKREELQRHLYKELKAFDGEKPVAFRLEGSGRVATGFVAQEVELAAREIGFDFDAVEAPQNENDLYALRYSEFVVPLVKAVQELSRLNDEKDSIIAEFKEMFNAIAQQEGRPLPFDIKGRLMQNYPNPSQQSTTVGFVLPEHYSNANIVLSDASGKTLRRVNITSRSTRVELSTSTLPAGIYNYSLVVDGRVVQTRQLTIAR